MSKKLSITLSALIALDLIGLQKLFIEASGETPDASWTPEMLQEEILKHAELKDDEHAKDQDLPEDHFSFEGKVYKVLIPKVLIPGIGVRSKAEICDDEEAQSYLIKQNCIGSVIKEVE